MSTETNPTTTNAANNTNTNITALPTELLVHIFSHLPMVDRFQRIRLVCRRWHQSATATVTQLTLVGPHVGEWSPTASPGPNANAWNDNKKKKPKFEPIRTDASGILAAYRDRCHRVEESVEQNQRIIHPNTAHLRLKSNHSQAFDPSNRLPSIFPVLSSLELVTPCLEQQCHRLIRAIRQWSQSLSQVKVFFREQIYREPCPLDDPQGREFVRKLRGINMHSDADRALRRLVTVLLCSAQLPALTTLVLDAPEATYVGNGRERDLVQLEEESILDSPPPKGLKHLHLHLGKNRPLTLQILNGLCLKSSSSNSEIPLKSPNNSNNNKNKLNLQSELNQNSLTRISSSSSLRSLYVSGQKPAHLDKLLPLLINNHCNSNGNGFGLLRLDQLTELTVDFGPRLIGEFRSSLWKEQTYPQYMVSILGTLCRGLAGSGGGCQLRSLFLNHIHDIPLVTVLATISSASNLAKGLRRLRLHNSSCSWNGLPVWPLDLADLRLAERMLHCQAIYDGYELERRPWPRGEVERFLASCGRFPALETLHCSTNGFSGHVRAFPRELLFGFSDGIETIDDNSSRSSPSLSPPLVFPALKQAIFDHRNQPHKVAEMFELAESEAVPAWKAYLQQHQLQQRHSIQPTICPDSVRVVVVVQEHQVLPSSSAARCCVELYHHRNSDAHWPPRRTDHLFGPLVGHRWYDHWVCSDLDPVRLVPPPPPPPPLPSPTEAPEEPPTTATAAMPEVLLLLEEDRPCWTVLQGGHGHSPPL